MRSLAFILTPQQQAVTYDMGYFYPGPAVKGVTLSQAPASSQQAIAKYGDPQFDSWISGSPIKNAPPAPMQVTAFGLWDTKIGSTKRWPRKARRSPPGRRPGRPRSCASWSCAA